MTTFPLNAWYAAAYDTECGRQLLARTVCGQAMALYRREDGSAVALEDACWHRLLPLSKGVWTATRSSAAITVLYTTAEGRCTHMPSQETINPSACVRSLPGRGKRTASSGSGRAIPLADPALIPDLHWNDDPAWAGDGKLIRVQVRLPSGARQPDGPDARDLRARRQIGDRAVAEAPFVATHGDRSATVTRWMDDIAPPPFWAGQIRRARGYTGRSTAGRSSASRRPAPWPSTSAWPRPAPARVPATAATGVNGFVLNTITPETDGSCHYFWAFARNY
jgi:vanillate O-demethylase monooxygenase subunit